MQTTDNNEMSSASSFAFDKSSARSFMYIRNKSGSNVEPWGTHKLAKEEVYTSENASKIAIHLMIYGILFIQRRTKRYNLYHLLLIHQTDIFLDHIMSF